jgi:RNA polymerase sigma factor (TIGR02999 family)
VSDNPPDITLLLRLWHAGDESARDKLFVLLEPKLKEIAASRLRRERPNHTLQRTELVNEAFMKLAGANNVIDWRDRNHFFAICTLMMRRFLIDYARKRPTYELLAIEDLPEGIMAGRNRLEVILAVDELLDELEKESPPTFRVLVARMYVGYEVKEIAEKYELKIRTVERHLHDGRKWLFQRLKKVD